MDSPDTTEALYPIRTVSTLTGVHPVTLRAWERRYGLIRPHRTPKGHRLYTRADVETIREVVELLGSGISIAQAKQRVGRSAPVAGPREPEVGAWDAYQGRMARAIEAFDESGLEAAYAEALSLYPVDLVTEHLVNPLLRRLGERWQGRPGGIAEEHFFATYLRNKLGARLHHLASQRPRHRVLAACPPGEHHELGLLLFCLAAANHGIGFVILGADTPLAEVAHAQRRAACGAVLLSASGDPDAGLLDGLSSLVLSAGVPVLVGGRAAAVHASAIESTGAIALGSDVPGALRRLLTLLVAGR